MYNLCLEDNINVIYILIYVIESNILFQICFLAFLYRNACCVLHVLGCWLTYMLLCVCRFMSDAECLSGVFSTFHIEVRSMTDPKVHCFS